VEAIMTGPLLFQAATIAARGFPSSRLSFLLRPKSWRFAVNLAEAQRFDWPGAPVEGKLRAALGKA
jgi:hypothetical protein